MKRHELTGKRFGYLTVQGLSEISRNGHSRWNVVCDCGVHKTVLGTHLIQGNTTGCGSCNLGPKSRNFQGVGDLPKTYYTQMIKGADGSKGRKPIPFEVSMEYLWEVFESQKGQCALSGLPIDFRSRTASADRIDSNLGYVEGNIQWLHKDVNMMKRHYTENYFKNLCKLITESSQTN